MIIFEKLFYKKIFKKNWDTPQKLISYLESKGFKEIGRGWYSVIMSLPKSKYAIKINSGDFDYGYCYFVDLCKKFKSSKNIIDIILHKNYSLSNNPFIFSLLPKLFIIEKHNYFNKKYIKKIDQIKSIVFDISFSEKSLDENCKNITEEDIVDIVKILYSIDKTRYGYDLCIENFLIDKHGNLILSDPIRSLNNT